MDLNISKMFYLTFCFLSSLSFDMIPDYRAHYIVRCLHYEDFSHQYIPILSFFVIVG